MFYLNMYMQPTPTFSMVLIMHCAKLALIAPQKFKIQGVLPDQAYRLFQRGDAGGKQSCDNNKPLK